MSNIVLPVKAKPYRHQVEAYRFTCNRFGLPEGGDVNPSISSRGTALLMEMLPWVQAKRLLR